MTRAARDDGVCKVCYVGGSITEQKAGYRPCLQRLLENILPKAVDTRSVDVHEIKASIGNVGSKVLNYLVDAWITDNDPDLVIIETAINDGDAIIEGEGDTEVANISRAVEGIVRQLRCGGGLVPHTGAPDIVIVHMHLCTNVAADHRTGTKAWADGNVTPEEAERAYQTCLADVYGRICEHYGVCYLNFRDALTRAPGEGHVKPTLLSCLYRDDCHFTTAGGAFAAAVLGNMILQSLTSPPVAAASAADVARPDPIDPHFWCGGQAILVARGIDGGGGSIGPAGRKAPMITFATPTGRPRQHHFRMDRDPLSGLPLRWLLLGVGDAIEFQFEGSSLALLTMSGPDSGMIHARLQSVESDAGREDGEPELVECQVQLFDQWSYYYRQSVCVIAESLPLKRWSARVWIDGEDVDRSITRKPAPAEGVEGPRKLWVSYILVRGDS